MPTGRWGILLLAAAIGGCGSDGAGGTGLPELAITRSTTFGDEEGDGALSNVWGVAVSRDGHVFLSEPQFARVVGFNPDGTFSHVVGGPGEGPGEFRIPGALTWRGDSLAVTDFQRGINLFTPDGAFADLIAFKINDGVSAFGLRPFFPMADGSIAAMAPAGNSQITAGTVSYEAWLKTSREGVIADTLAIISVAGRLFAVRYQEGGWSGMHPLGWAPLLTAPPNGTSLVIVDRPVATDGDSATYRVLRVGLDGDTLNAANVAYRPVPVLAEQIDSIATAMAQGWGERLNATDAAVAAEVADQLAWPAYQPPVTAVLAGVDGSVWLRRETMGVPSARWEIYDGDLSPVGWVGLPLDFEVKVVATEWAYGVELDAFDVPRVVRFDVSGKR